MKKLLTIAIAMFVLGCGAAPSQGETTGPSNGSGGDINLPDNSSDYASPCDMPTYQKLLINGQEVVVEVPTLCNTQWQPDRGDPAPDQGDPNPWDKQAHPESYKVFVQQERQAINER